MENVASKMQMEKIERIFKSGQSPKKIFKLIALDDVGDTVLGTPLFKKWFDYVEVFNKENPSKKESWFLPLRVFYHSSDLERMIDRGMQNPATMKIAKLVESARLQDWLEYWKYPPKDVFHFLYLEKAGKQTFSSPKFKLWAKYLDDFNERYPDQKTTMIDSLEANYNERVLLEIFYATKKDPQTGKLATKLEDALFKIWLLKKTGPAYIKRTFDLVRGLDDIVKRYSKMYTASSLS